MVWVGFKGGRKPGLGKEYELGIGEEGFLELITIAYLIKTWGVGSKRVTVIRILMKSLIKPNLPINEK